MKNLFLVCCCFALLMSSCAKDPIGTEIAQEETQVSGPESVDFEVRDNLIDFATEDDFVNFSNFILSGDIDPVLRVLESKGFNSLHNYYVELHSQIDMLETEQEVENFVKRNSDYVSLEDSEIGRIVEVRTGTFLDYITNLDFQFSVAGDVRDGRLEVNGDNSKAACGWYQGDYEIYGNCSNGRYTRWTSKSWYSSNLVIEFKLQAFKSNPNTCMWVWHNRNLKHIAPNEMDVTHTPWNGAPIDVEWVRLTDFECGYCIQTTIGWTYDNTTIPSGPTTNRTRSVGNGSSNETGGNYFHFFHNTCED